MNQILVSEKIYVTPELRKKKKIYKISFVLSIITIIVLCSFYVYGEYDRASSDKSQEILADLNNNSKEVVASTNADSTIKNQDDILVVVLDKPDETKQKVDLDELIAANNSVQMNSKVYKTDRGDEYTTVAVVNIPKINITYPIIYSNNTSDQTTEDLLKISIVKYWGADANQPGNFCMIGHNYHNKRFFSNISKLNNGDSIYVTDKNNKTLEYKVYNNYVIEPTDLKCTSQLTNGNTDITLITCTISGKQRTVIKARAVNTN